MGGKIGFWGIWRFLGACCKIWGNLGGKWGVRPLGAREMGGFWEKFELESRPSILSFLVILKMSVLYGYLESRICEKYKILPR